MNPLSLIRDVNKVHAALEEMPNESLVAKKACKIYIPSRFAERGLAYIGIETIIVGIYAIVVEDTYYAVSNITAMVRITPSAMNKVKVEEDEYYEFCFEKGDVVIPSLQLVKEDVMPYKIYNEMLAKGRVPWYLDYNDLGSIFDTAKYHSGANIGTNREVTELLVSIIARDPNNRHLYYRTTLKSYDDMKKRKPAYIPLRSVIYAATNTTNKIAGSYMSSGMVSALVTPSERTERIEHLLRK